MTRIRLSPESGVEKQGGRFVATSIEPWLTIEPHAALQPGAIFEFVYRMSLWDEPARPIFRFWRPGGEWWDQIAPGPIAGTAIWTGRIPAETVQISVSPTNRLGRFDFNLESISRASFGALLARGLRRRPGAALRALHARFSGLLPKSDVRLDARRGFTPLASYEYWRNARLRPIDLEGIDAPRHDWTTSATIDLVVDVEHAQPGDIARLIAGLRAQIYPRWRLHLAADRDLQELPGDPRIARLACERIAAVLRAVPDDCIVGAVAAGDALHPYALAMIAEATARLPEMQVFYGDEEYRRSDGKLVPVLKPAWSPVLQAERPYLGHAVFLRPRVLADLTDAEASAFVAKADFPRGATARFSPSKVHSLRRVLLTRALPWPDREQRLAEPSSAPIGSAANPSALIIIPARDQALLLSRCVASIFARTEFNNFSIIIVDNDSVEPETQRLFETFRGDRIVSVLRSPGPFNHSLLCNAAAARRKADVLVFLNHATEVLTTDWLDRLVAHALLPDAGAIGGPLLDRRRRVRHAGIVLGWDDDAEPFGAGTPQGAPGWLARHEVAHEVSAVQKTCLAVARRKFMLVGGFDADHLPFEHNDSDLCLRLAERGWTARIDPKVRFVHAGSGLGDPSCGKVDEMQRRWFRARWLAVLRDDPFFHPGLSLSCSDEALS